MQTLTAYEYLDRDMILKGVAETIVKESPILNKLPMKAIQGNSLKYNVELTLPAANWLTVGDQISESTGTYEQRTSDVYTLIANGYTDKSKIALNATQNPETIDTEAAAKAMAHEFERCFILGQTSTVSNAKQFKGLCRMIAELESATTTDLDGAASQNSQVIEGAADYASAALTLALMDELVDAIRPGKPDLILCSRLGRRKLNVLQRASGSGMQMIQSKEFGLHMSVYDTIPIMPSDWVPDNVQDGASSVLAIASYNPATARASGYDNTLFFALKLAEDAVTGLQAGEMKHEREEMVEDYNAILNRYVWYVGAAIFKKYSAAVLINVNPDP